MPMPHSPNYSEFIISLEVRESKSSSVFFCFFFKMVLVTLGPLQSHLNFRENLLKLARF